jgi:dihydroflavonol-4-reductase
LKDGSYNVKGTVRDKDNAPKIEPLKKAFGDLFNNLELVNADLTDDASMAAAIQGAHIVVHTASPFALKGEADEESYTKPAV